MHEHSEALSRNYGVGRKHEEKGKEKKKNLARGKERKTCRVSMSYES